MRPGTQYLRITQAMSDADEGAHLGLVSSAPVYIVERIRTADGVPIVYSRDILAQELVVKADLEAVASQESIHAVLQSVGHNIVQGIATISPTKATVHLSAKLLVPVGSLLMRVDQVDYGMDGRPILLSNEFCAAGFGTFTVARRGPSV